MHWSLGPGRQRAVQPILDRGCEAESKSVQPDQPELGSLLKILRQTITSGRMPGRPTSHAELSRNGTLFLGDLSNLSIYLVVTKVTKASCLLELLLLLEARWQGRNRPSLENFPVVPPPCPQWSQKLVPQTSFPDQPDLSSSNK